MKKKIIVTGGAGYVGSALVPKLLQEDYRVTVIDLFLYGNTLQKHKNLNLVRGDIRDKNLLEKVLPGNDVLIHLACISNDPSFELNPNLGKSINFDSFEPLVNVSKKSGLKRFVYASSSSVYGIKSENNVHEKMSLNPITDYSFFKAKCEDVLNKYAEKSFVVTTLRPATVCGYSPRQRLDLVVNILTNLGYHKKKIIVFGGDQFRPNIHIQDMVRSYLTVIKAEEDIINSEIFNVGYENIKVKDIASLIKEILSCNVEIEYQKTNDKRSYHISSDKFYQKLNFQSKFTIKNAIQDLIKAFDNRLLLDTFDNDNYFNIEKMKKVHLT